MTVERLEPRSLYGEEAAFMLAYPIRDTSSSEAVAVNPCSLPLTRIYCFCNNSDMTSSTPVDNAELDAAAIVDAATRLAMVRRLADLAMRLAEEIVERAISSPYHPEPVHEPARAFATISRAVRPTLVLQERMEAKLTALRKGEAAPVEKPSSAHPKHPVGAAPDDTADDAPERSDRSRETLREREGERFDELISGEFDDCIAVIRTDLGLASGDDIPSDHAGVQSALGTVLEAASAPSFLNGAATPKASGTSAPERASQPPDSG